MTVPTSFLLLDDSRVVSSYARNPLYVKVGDLSGGLRPRDDFDKSVCHFRFHTSDVGVMSGGGTPVPIPNTVVKPASVDDTCSARDWESRPMPTSEV